MSKVAMTEGQVYNWCIGTTAESPKEGMRVDGTRTPEPTEMQLAESGKEEDGRLARSTMSKVAMTDGQVYN